MLIPNHPDDERLSALASRDTDAIADAELHHHVASCTRCTELVNELGALRVALADLPDLRAVAAAPARPARRGGATPSIAWAAGRDASSLPSWCPAPRWCSSVSSAPLRPAFSGMALKRGGSAQSAAAELAAVRAASAPRRKLRRRDESRGTQIGRSGSQARGRWRSASREAPPPSRPNRAQTSHSDGGWLRPIARRRIAQDDASHARLVEPTRSPWPMVLFAGVALIIAALLMRWILAPRSA